MKENQVLATLMTPEGYGDPSARWDTYRNTKFAEIIGFYGITYWYTFQVSMLGVAPVWLGSNEKLKHKAAQLLQKGMFALLVYRKKNMALIFTLQK